MNDPTQPLRDAVEPLERIIEAAEAVKYEIEMALEDCEDEPRSTIREIVNGTHLDDIGNIEGGLLDLKQTLDFPA